MPLFPMRRILAAAVRRAPVLGAGMPRLGLSWVRGLAVSVDKKAMLPLHPVLEAAMYREAAPGAVAEKKQRLRRRDDLRSAVAHSRNLRGSPWKMNMICKQIRGKAVAQAQVQMKFSAKQHYSPLVEHCLKKAIALAEINHGLLPPQLRISEVVVNKAKWGKKIRYHAKGRTGVMRIKFCNISIRLEEIDWDFEIASAYDTQARDATLRLKQAVEQGGGTGMLEPDFRLVFAPKKRRTHLEEDARRALADEEERLRQATDLAQGGNDEAAVPVG